VTWVKRRSERISNRSKVEQKGEKSTEVLGDAEEASLDLPLLSLSLSISWMMNEKGDYCWHAFHFLDSLALPNRDTLDTLPCLTRIQSHLPLHRLIGRLFSSTGKTALFATR
jgi:hypothetical protein